MKLLAGAFFALLLTTSCRKVPLEYSPARFRVAQAAWFEAEQTLFLFWNVGSALKLGNESVVEVSYRTDDEIVNWKEPHLLNNIHTHLKAKCGDGRLCGSASPKVAKAPRRVAMRVRYHRDGKVFEEKIPVQYVVRSGTSHENRSFLVYGVFDETNTFVQWRGRHIFPAMRNQEVTALGLRRLFTIENQTYGTDATPWIPTNPYHYGINGSCPSDFSDAAVDAEVSSRERAIFNTIPLPLAAGAASSVCAKSTVTDGTGSFVATAYARKNPETRAAFESLHSPVKSTRAIGFVLSPCQRTISAEHLAMQKQRLLLEDPKTICTDNFGDVNFASDLTAKFQQQISEVRANGDDMTLFIALHSDDVTGGLSRKLEEALANVLPVERSQVSPRVVGAFVYDSMPHVVLEPRIKNLALWCPAAFLDSKINPDDSPPDESQQSCPVLPEVPGLSLGPFAIGTIPILPSRTKYEKFIKKYSEAQAGSMKSVVALAPERATLSTDVATGDYGWVTFFNNERITAAPTDAFSFCWAGSDDAWRFYFKNVAEPDTPAPIAILPSMHATSPQTDYEIGLAFDFPFLLRLEYSMTLAGSVSALSASVPFGMDFSQKSSYGAEEWLKSDIVLGEALTQCTRFCGHPAFDESGVYGASQSWSAAFASRCFRPRYPRPSDGGFPRDP